MHYEHKYYLSHYVRIPLIKSPFFKQIHYSMLCCEKDINGKINANHISRLQFIQLILFLHI